jgi:hypothetical protein
MSGGLAEVDNEMEVSKHVKGQNNSLGGFPPDKEPQVHRALVKANCGN